MSWKLTQVSNRTLSPSTWHGFLFQQPVHCCLQGTAELASSRKSTLLPGASVSSAISLCPVMLKQGSQSWAQLGFQWYWLEERQSGCSERMIGHMCRQGSYSDTRCLFLDCLTLFCCDWFFRVSYIDLGNYICGLSNLTPLREYLFILCSWCPWEMVLSCSVECTFQMVFRCYLGWVWWDTLVSPGS